MTISSISSMASPANVQAASMKRLSQSDTALHFGHRFGSFDSEDSFVSNDSFGIPSQYWADNAHDSDLEEKVSAPPVEEESKTDTDTASLNSQRTRKRYKIWSFLSGKRVPRPSLNPAPSMQLHDGGQRRWSLPEQPSAQRESKRKRLGNWLLKPFRSRENSLTQAASDDAAISRHLEELYQLEGEKSLSLPPSSASRVFQTPPSSNDRRTTL